MLDQQEKMFVLVLVYFSIVSLIARTPVDLMAKLQSSSMR